jgi:hypothetical protein
MERLECKHCGREIGEYEPMYVVTEAQPRKTSRAAEGRWPDVLGDCYHGACYREAYDEGAAPE